MKLNSEMGQSLGLKLSGVHWVLGQTNDQCLIPGMRGVEKTSFGGVGPTVVVTKHHQSG